MTFCLALFYIYAFYTSYQSHMLQLTEKIYEFFRYLKPVDKPP